MAELDGAGSDLDRWLEPFLKVLGHTQTAQVVLGVWW
jgi:hypothetical protein